MRTSDWNSELMPAACATAGMISASGGGPLFAVDVTGAVRLTETVVVDVGVPSRGATCLPEALAPNVTSTAPVLVPIGSPFGSAVTLRVMPAAGTMPDDGVTVSHGTFAVAVNGVPSAAAMLPALPPMTIW